MKILEQAFSKIKPVRKNTYNFFLKLIEFFFLINSAYFRVILRWLWFEIREINGRCSVFPSGTPKAGEVYHEFSRPAGHIHRTFWGPCHVKSEWESVKNGSISFRNYFSKKNEPRRFSVPLVLAHQNARDGFRPSVSRFPIFRGFPKPCFWIWLRARDPFDLIFFLINRPQLLSIKWP